MLVISRCFLRMGRAKEAKEAKEAKGAKGREKEGDSETAKRGRLQGKEGVDWWIGE